MITIEKINVSYDRNPVLKDLSLIIETGSIHGLVGLNGAGKTTLLNAIYGFKKRDKGTITFNRQPLKKKEIAYLEAENYFFSKITGSEYLGLFNPDSHFELEEWNLLFKLPLHELIEVYSTGMKKKLALLGILKLNKPIIILDEPFNGLDLETSKILALIVQRLKHIGKTIIITSHILESLTRLCDKISYLEGGAIQKTYVNTEFSIFEQLLDEKLKESVTHSLLKVLP